MGLSSTPAVGLILAAICVLVHSQPASLNTYSALVAGGLVVPLDLTLSFIDNANPEPRLYNDGFQCPVDNEECQKPVFKKEKGSVLKIAFNLPQSNETIRLQSLRDSELGEPQLLTLRACYAKESTADREWRKAKDEIDKDKRCGENIVENLNATAGSGEVDFRIPPDTPKAKFFLTAILKCPLRSDPESHRICGLDTTGGLDALVSEESVTSKLGIAGTSDQTAVLMMATTSKTIYYRTLPSHHHPRLLVGGVIGFSVFSVAALIFFIVYEHTLKKSR